MQTMNLVPTKSDILKAINDSKVCGCPYVLTLIGRTKKEIASVIRELSTHADGSKKAGNVVEFWSAEWEVNVVIAPFARN